MFSVEKNAPRRNNKITNNESGLSKYQKIPK